MPGNSNNSTFGVIIDSSGAVAGRIVAQNEFRKIGREAEKVEKRTGGAFMRMRRMIVGALAGITAITALNATIRTVAQFEQSMSQVRAITRGTDQDIQRLTKTARELGGTTVFSAKEAAEGMRFLGMAGFDTTQIVEAMPAVLDLAAAGFIDLGSAADIASNIMSGFQIPANETRRVADVLALAASSANTDIRELGEGMKFVSPVARALGFTLEETTAVLGVLANNGIKAGLGGRGLTQVFLKLVNDTPRANKVLREYGLSVAQVDPRIVGLTESLRLLNGVDITDLSKLFGEGNIDVFKALQSSTLSIEELEKALNNADGASKAMAATMSDNLIGDFKSLKSALDELVLGKGSGGLLKWLRDATKFSTNLVRAMAGMDEHIEGNVSLYQDLAKAIETLIKVAAAFIALKLGASLLGLWKLTGVLMGAIVALNLKIAFFVGIGTKMATVLTTLTGVFGLFAAAIIGFKLGQWAFDNFSIVRQVSIAVAGDVMKNWEDVKGSFKLVWTTIEHGWEKMTNFLVKTMLSGVKLIVKIVEGLAKTVLAPIMSIMEGLEGVARRLKQTKIADSLNQSQVDLAGAIEKPTASVLSGVDAMIAELKDPTALSKKAAAIAEAAKIAKEKIDSDVKWQLEKELDGGAIRGLERDPRALPGAASAGGVPGAGGGDGTSDKFDPSNSDHSVARLIEEMKKYNDANEERGIIDDEITKRLQENSASWADSFAAGVERSIHAMGTMNERVAEMGSQVVNSLERNFTNAFVGMINGTKSVKQAFGDMATSIVADLVRIIVKQIIVKALMAAMTGGAGAFMPVPAFHGGGVVGMDSGMTGFASAGTFSSATRMHSGGIMSDERPIIGQVGEEVLTEDDPRHRNNQAGNKQKDKIELTVILVESEERGAEMITKNPDAVLVALADRQTEVKAVIGG